MGSMMMLNDVNALNMVNPFVIDGPGTSNKPYGYSPGVPDKDQVQCDSYGCSLPSSQPSLDRQSYIEKKVSRSPWEPVDRNPLSPWGINASTNGSLDAPMYREPKNPKPCFMGRPLEPTQEFLPDLYTQIPYRDPMPVELRKPSETFPILAVVILIGALLALTRIS